MNNSKISLVGGVAHQTALAATDYRRYATTLTSATTLNGNRDSASKVTIYKVGFRGAAAVSETDAGDPVLEEYALLVNANPSVYRGSKMRRELLARLRSADLAARRLAATNGPLNPAMRALPVEVLRIPQPYRTTEMSAATLVAFSRRYTHVSGEFRTSDHSALVERLAMGLAYYSVTGELTCEDLAARQALNLTCVSMIAAPLNASDNTVWVPRGADSLSTPNCVAAITAACAAIGSTPVTDMVALNADNEPIMPVASGIDLVAGILSALRLIGSNYGQSTAGSLFSYAFIRGLNNILSVVGMTDEGGLMRDVLRTNGFVPSYGGLSPSAAPWSGLPTPSDLSQSGIAALVDGMLLTAAAGVAVCDPCVTIDGRVYPTVCTRDAAIPTECGVNTPVGAGDKANIVASVITAAPAFASNYVTYLTKMLLFSPDDYAGSAHDHLLASFSRSSLLESRHLNYATVAPFFWVEPTGLVPEYLAGSTATAAGYGPLTYPGTESTIPLFPNSHELVDEGSCSEVVFEWRSARTVGALLHFGNHESDGLAHSRVVGSDPNSWLHLGGESLAVRERMLSGHDLASYCWARGDVAIPAPGEAIYTGRSVAIFNKHATINELTWRSTTTHFPLPHELGGEVTLRVSAPMPYGVGPLGPDRHATRSYSHAARALENARLTGAFPRGMRAGRVRFSDPAPIAPVFAAVTRELSVDSPPPPPAVADLPPRVVEAPVAAFGSAPVVSTVTATGPAVDRVVVPQVTRGPVIDRPRATLATTAHNLPSNPAEQQSTITADAGVN